jgi:apolipoprotein N-acyltransferase
MATTNGLATTLAAVMTTIVWNIPGSMGALQVALDGSMCGASKAGTASAFGLAGSISPWLRMTLGSATTGDGIRTKW